MVRRCWDTTEGTWRESCTRWAPDESYTMEVDTSDYPYPFRAMRGTWSVADGAKGGSRITMRFDYRMPRGRMPRGPLAAVVEGMVLAAESAGAPDAYGVMRPHPRFLYAAMGLQSELYPRALQILRELAGGGVIQPPSSFRDLQQADARADLERYVQSPELPGEQRSKLFKLAWDIVGTEFAGRHQQYEMFYAGAPFITKSYLHRFAGYEEALESADSFLAEYGLPGEP